MKFNFNFLSKKVFFQISINIFFPLLIGLFIYLFLRPVWPNAIFNILQFLEINISPPIISQENFKSIELYRFIIFNLPDALWAYSFGFFICLTTQKESLSIRRSYHLFAIFVASLLELLQGSVIEGTYDPLDLFLILCSYTLSIRIFWSSNESAFFKN